MTERKTFLVDLDNVVYPFVEVMAHLVARDGLSPNMHPAELVHLYKSWELWDDWQVPKGGFDRIWERAIQTGEMWGVSETATAFPYSRAVRSLWEISDNEWGIHIVTSRLNKFRLHDDAVKNTAEWLQWANIPYRSLTFTSDKSSILGDAIIDDQPANLIDHPAPIKILYPSPHNANAGLGDEQGITVLQEGEGVYPWDEVPALLGSGVRS